MEKESQGNQKEFTGEEKKSDVWDEFSGRYMSEVNKNMLSLMSSLMSLTRVSKRANILDAGCGPGLGTRQIISDVQPFNSNVYAFDFSPEMVKYCGKIFSEFEDFNANKNNHWDIFQPNADSKINVFKDTEEIRKTKTGKVVRFFQGDAQILPFEDEQFDAYLSGLCLNLVEDADKAMSEAHRVLKKDGVAAFSVWGDKTKTNIAFHVFNQMYSKYGITPSTAMNPYALAENLDELRARFIKAGFSDVRMEYTNVFFDSFTGEDYIRIFKSPMVTSTLKSVTDEKIVKDFFEDVNKEAQRQIDESKSIPCLNALVIVAFK